MLHALFADHEELLLVRGLVDNSIGCPLPEDEETER